MRPRLRKGLALLLLLTAGLSLSGCWDNREPQLRAYVLGMGIDPDPDDDQGLILSLQLPVPSAANPGKPGGGGAHGQEYFVVQGRGRSLATAMQDAQDRVSRELFFGQMRAVVLSSTLQPSQAERVFTSMRANPDVEDTVYLAITSGRAFDALSTKVKLEPLPALYFNSVFEAVRRMTIADPVQFWQFWRADKTSGWEPVIPRVEQSQRDSLEVRGMGVYHGYEFRGFLDGEETQGFLWLQGKTRSRSLVVETPSGISAVRSLGSTARTSIRFEGNQPVFRVDIALHGEVSLPPNQQTGGARELEEVAQATQDRVRDQVEAVLTRAQEELRADIFGFGKRLFYHHPRYFAGVDWSEIFPTVKIEPVVKVSILRKGAIH